MFCLRLECIFFLSVDLYKRNTMKIQIIKTLVCTTSMLYGLRESYENPTIKDKKYSRTYISVLKQKLPWQFVTSG